MSEPRIALVAEGATDYELIKAALQAILQRPFFLTLLQPESNLPALGGGWGGVLKWCDAAGKRHAGSLDADPTLELFDLLIIKCNPAAEAGLAQLPIALRVKRKSAIKYRRHAASVDTNWAAVKALCSRAGVFEQAVLAVLP